MLSRQLPHLKSHYCHWFPKFLFALTYPKFHGFLLSRSCHGILLIPMCHWSLSFLKYLLIRMSRQWPKSQKFQKSQMCHYCQTCHVSRQNLKSHFHLNFPK